MTVRNQLVNVIDTLDEQEQILLFQIAIRFADDIATPDDLEAIKESEAEYAAGETINHNDINWD